MHSFDEDRMLEQVRSSLEAYLPHYEPSSWTRMELLLDKQMPKPRHWFWFFKQIFIGMFAVGFILGVLYFSWDKSSTEVADAVGVSLTYSNSMQENTMANVNGSVSTQPQGEDAFVERDVVGTPDNGNGINLNVFKNDSTLGEHNSDGSDSIFKELNLTEDCEHELHVEALTPIQSLPPLIESSFILADKLHGFKPLAAHSSEDATGKTKSKNVRRFSWIQGFKPSFSFSDGLLDHFVGPNSITATYSPQVVTGGFQSRAGISQGVSLLTSGSITSRLDVGVGLSYRGYRYSNRTEFGSMKIRQDAVSDTSLVYVVDSLHLRKGEWRFFEVPVEVSYKVFTSKKLDARIALSLNANLIWRERQSFTRVIDDFETTQYFNPPNFSNFSIVGSASLGLEFSYKISKRLHLTVKPRYNFHIQPFGVIGLKQNAFEVNVGLTFRFRDYF